MTYTPETYTIERSICDRAKAYAESVMVDPITGKRRNFLTAEESAHSDYAACDNDMRGRVEQFEILRDLPDVIVAYLGEVFRGTFPVQVWTGLAIGNARCVSEWRVNSYMSTTRGAFRATIGGREYHGRGFGAGMSIVLRAVKGSTRP